ncbi:MAG: hypothetical protein ABEJ58_08115 [Halodesulfurarchaeum sp.]
MDLTHDELAGIVDLFGALPEPTLQRAVEELAFRQGEEIDAEALDEQIERAREAFYLLGVPGEPSLLVPGPASFPSLPEGAADLPHVLDVEERSVSDEVLERALRTQLARATAQTTDPQELADLMDVTYDAEAWTDLDLADVRDRLENARPGPR